MKAETINQIHLIIPRILIYPFSNRHIG